MKFLTLLLIVFALATPPLVAGAPFIPAGAMLLDGGDIVDADKSMLEGAMLAMAADNPARTTGEGGAAINGRSFAPVEADGWFFGPLAHACWSFTNQWRTVPGGSFVGASLGTAVPWVSDYIDLDLYGAAGLFLTDTHSDARDAYELGLLYRMEALETLRWSAGVGVIPGEAVNTPGAWFCGAGLVKDF